MTPAHHPAPTLGMLEARQAADEDSASSLHLHMLLSSMLLSAPKKRGHRACKSAGRAQDTDRLQQASGESETEQAPKTTRSLSWSRPQCSPAHRVSKPRGTESVGDSVGEGQGLLPTLPTTPSWDTNAYTV